MTTLNNAATPDTAATVTPANNDENVIIRTVKVTLKDKTSFAIPVTMSFDDVEHSDLVTWAGQSRVIDMQRMLRTLTPETLGEMASEGLVVNASTCTVKPVSFTETKAQIKQLASTMTQEEKDAMIAALMA